MPESVEPLAQHLFVAILRLIAEIDARLRDDAVQLVLDRRVVLLQHRLVLNRFDPRLTGGVLVHGPAAESSESLRQFRPLSLVRCVRHQESPPSRSSSVIRSGSAS